MQTEFVHIGFGGNIAVHRMVAVASPDSAPLKRLIRQATKESRIINLTYGRKAKSVIVMDSGHLVLAAFQPQIILRRIAFLRASGGQIDLGAAGAEAPAEEDAREH